MKNKLKALVIGVPLLANSINLMLATGITAIFGFVFWIIVARTFDTSTVGLATTLLSVSSFISLMGLAGFDTIFIRYLSGSKRKNDQINSGLLIVAFSSALLAAIFCILIPVLSPKLKFLDHNVWYLLGFIIFTVFTSWNTLTNSILIAYRRTALVLYINIIFGALRMLLPFLLSSNGGPMKIFIIVGIAQVVNVMLSLAALAKYFNYIPSLKIHTDIVKETLHFGIMVYVANIMNLLPDSALPLIVIDKLGAAAAAYFYIAFTIANLLYTIAFSTTQALLAEGSHDEEHYAEHVRKGIKIIIGLLVPAIILVTLFCPLILNLFGHNYQSGATTILRIMSISGLSVMIYSLVGSVFKLTYNLRGLIVTTVSNAVLTIALSLLLATRYGLNGVGWAWLIGSTISACIGLMFLAKSPKKFHITSSFKKVS